MCHRHNRFIGFAAYVPSPLRAPPRCVTHRAGLRAIRQEVCEFLQEVLVTAEQDRHLCPFVSVWRQRGRTGAEPTGEGEHVIHVVQKV
jgi:hypothetical protein